MWPDAVPMRVYDLSLHREEVICWESSVQCGSMEVLRSTSCVFLRLAIDLQPDAIPTSQVSAYWVVCLQVLVLATITLW